MKKILLLFFLCLSFFVSKGQSSKYDNRLFEVYNLEFLNRLEKQSPQVIDLLTFELDNSYKIYNILANKDLVFDGTLNLLDNFNILLMLKTGTVEQTQYVKKYYKIEGREEVLVVFSKNDVVNKFNKKQR